MKCTIISLQRNGWANSLEIFQLVKNNRFHSSLKKLHMRQSLAVNHIPCQNRFLGEC
uniref:Uncharacterized protein n=1 Tax=Meloidogyne enterolobii TaxID=390850 RepID=A0A6V7UZU0_MELEN|nr:unnamed protein product [Meloidogyne enterolobii]